MSKQELYNTTKGPSLDYRHHNYCAKCETRFDKKIKRCPYCGHVLRTKRRTNKGKLKKQFGIVE